MFDSDLTYSQALTELETLVQALDREEVDVDELTTKVRRAAELVRFCRSRIQLARAEIEVVVAEMDAEIDAQGGFFESNTEAGL